VVAALRRGRRLVADGPRAAGGDGGAPGQDPGDQTGDLDRRLAAAAERLGHGARLLLRAAATRHGLSVIQAQLLLRLASDSSGASSIASLTEWFDVRQPTISDAVAALGRKHLVVSTREGRRRHLALTDTGRRVSDDLSRWDEPLRAAFAGQPVASREAALAVMLHTIGALQAAGVIGIVRSCTTCRFFRPASSSQADARHHCALLDAPLHPSELRLDCPEHQGRPA
jgi:DNA-binding MarR family transcriptional regulator